MKNRPDNSKHTHIIGISLMALLPAIALLIPAIPLRGNTVMELPFLDSNKKGKVLVFGGFPECSSICPTSLSEIQQAYKQYKEITNKNDLRILFLNIKLDTPEAITRAYAKSFHDDFEGYSLRSSQASHLYKTLALKTFTSETTSASHKGFIYLFTTSDNQSRLERVFNYDTKQEQIIKHLLKKTA